MIDKNKYTAFIKDEETKTFIIKNISKIEGVLKHFDEKKTDFMNPYEQKVFISILNAFSEEISYALFGGDEKSERKLFVIYPVYQMDEIKCPVKLLRLYGNFKFEKISHRDCLGALMSMGIVREKTGDIYLHEDYVDIVIDESIDDYLLTNFKSIRHCSVKSEILDIDELEVSNQEFDLKLCSVSSLRLDNIISEAYNLPRATSTNIVKSNRVKVDYEPILSPSKEVLDNCLISVKGYGRFKYIAQKGMSKKGKIRVELQLIK